MTIQQNTDRIQTTHIGSLPRPHALLDVMKAKYSGQPVNAQTYAAMLAAAVNEAVRKQAACGIDIVTDGDSRFDLTVGGKSWFFYPIERLGGIEDHRDTSRGWMSRHGLRSRASAERPRSLAS